MQYTRLFRWLDRLLLTELLVLTFILGCCLGRDMDIWWHLKAGRQLLAGEGIPRTDSYIFAVSGAPWIDLHWGFQLAVAWLFERGGFAALPLAVAAMASGAVAIALRGTTRQRSVLANVLCWLPAVLLMSTRFQPRPEIVSLVCLAAFLTLLHTAEARPARLWLLVPIQLLWVNVQGLFVLGPVLLLCWLINRVVSRAAACRWQSWRHIVGATMAVALACFVNPYVWRGALFPLTLWRRLSTEHDFYGRHIGELTSIPDLLWRTGISSVSMRLAFVLLAAAVLSFALCRRRSALVYFRLLALLLFSALWCMAIRNQAQFALIAGAVLAWNVGDWCAARPAPPLIDRLIARIATSALLVGCLLWVVSGKFYAAAGDGRVVGVGEQPLWYAHDAAQRAARADMPRHFLVYHEGQAAVFEFYMRPDQRVFVDPRLEVVPRRALEEYYAIASAMARGQPEWTERLRRLPQPLGILVNHATHAGIAATLLAHPGWRCIWFDAVAGVYVPSTAGQGAAQHGVDFGAWYFGADRGRAQPAAAHAATAPLGWRSLTEADSLFKVGRELLARGAAGQSQGQLLMLLAMERARTALRHNPDALGAWRILANASYHLYGPPQRDVPAPEWQPATVIGLTRLRYFLRRVLQRAPADFDALLALFGAAQALGDPDAMRHLGTTLGKHRAVTLTQYEVLQRVRALGQALPEPPAPAASGRAAAAGAELSTQVLHLIAEHRFLRALGLLEQVADDHPGEVGQPWELVDRWAMLSLLAGVPERARAIWASSREPTVYQPVLQARLASTYLTEGRLSQATDAYHAALVAHPDQATTRYALAITALESGDSEGVVRQCTAALAAPDLPQSLQEACREMRTLAAPYASRK